MKPLPHWALTDKHPAFYETESGTSIEMTAKVYAAMQTLIKEYNAFVDELNKKINEWENGTIKSNDEFKACITCTIEKYIKSIDIAIDKQDLKIDNAIEYMKNNIFETTTNVLNDAIAAGQIVIVENYDPETESLNMTATGGV